MTFPASSSAAAAVVFVVPLVALVRNKKKKPEKQVPADREVLTAAVSLRVMLPVVVSEQLLSVQ